MTLRLSLCGTALGMLLSLPLAAEQQVITLDSATNMALAVSPDGQYLVVDLLGQLWQLPVGGGGAKPLTPPEHEARNPRFAPDGEHVLYQSYAGGQWDIWQLSLATGERRPLTSGPFDDREPDVAPDGARVVFASDRGGNYDIWTLDLNTDELSQLTSGAGEASFPSYSADGAGIVFVNRRGPRWSLELLEDGATRTLVTSSDRLRAPSWRPGGAVIAYVEHGAGWAALKLLLLGSDPVTKTLTEDEDVFGFRPAWLSGAELMYTADGGLWRRSIDAKKRQAVPLFAAITVNRPEYHRRVRNFDSGAPQPLLGIRGPSVSPNGETLAFTALGDLWLAERSGEARRLTQDPFLDIDPVFTPDGNSLVFASDRGGGMEIWQLDLDTGAARQVTRGEGSAYLPSVAPGGDQLAYLRAGRLGLWGRSDIYVGTLDGQSRLLKAALPSPSRPSWDPQGQRLLLSSLAPFSKRFREGRNQLLSIRLADGEARWQPTLGAAVLGTRGHDGPAMTADGRQITTIANGRLFVGPPGAPEALLENLEPLGRELASSPSFSANGQVLVHRQVDAMRRLDLNTGKSAPWPLALTWRRPARTEQYVIQVGRLFDGIGNRYRRHMDIHVDGRRISAVVARGTLPNPGRVIDASDLTVIPGLIDSHAHQSALAGERQGRRWLAFGVTSVREPGGDPYDALERKEAWASGQRLGPRLFFTGHLLDGPRVYYSQAAPIADRDRLVQELDRARRLGFDLVKTYVRLPDELQREAIRLAHEIGIPVSSHEVYPAALFGADAVEHLGATSRRSFNPKVSPLQRSYSDLDQILAAAGMVFTPTLALNGGFSLTVADHPELLNDPAYLALFSPAERRGLIGFLGFFGSGPPLQQRMSQLGATAARLVRSGARLTAGTDAPFIPYGLGLHVELQVLQATGLSADQVLRLATAEAALALGAHGDLGTIEAGRLADLVVLDGDPLQNIHNTLRIRAVVSDGRWLSRESLLVTPDLATNRSSSRARTPAVAQL
jgi:Tol biopolymer transport system component/cytosine/adenosine deaminase-related metal-dependent hydrolase